MNLSRKNFFIFLGSVAFATAASCDSRGSAADKTAAGSAFAAAAAESASYVDRVERAAASAALPAELAAALAASARDARSEFEAELAAAVGGDEYLTKLVDKAAALPESYEPTDLTDLDIIAQASFKTNRRGHRLRAAAAEALERMAAAARADGVALMVSSAHRSYAYQRTVYDRIVRELGQAAADRESARPGHSQHQLGLCADFGSISDAFAETAASRWLEANAARFGWSLSYPKGYEEVTGYRWESWHYRYVGESAASLIDRRFGGVQQYALAFLAAWKKSAGE